jgi:hypothetical protein
MIVDSENNLQSNKATFNDTNNTDLNKDKLNAKKSG